MSQTTSKSKKGDNPKTSYKQKGSSVFSKLKSLIISIIAVIISIVLIFIVNITLEVNIGSLLLKTILLVIFVVFVFVYIISSQKAKRYTFSTIETKPVIVKRKTIKKKIPIPEKELELCSLQLCPSSGVILFSGIKELFEDNFKKKIYYFQYDQQNCKELIDFFTLFKNIVKSVNTYSFRLLNQGIESLKDIYQQQKDLFLFLDYFKFHIIFIDPNIKILQKILESQNFFDYLIYCIIESLNYFYIHNIKEAEWMKNVIESIFVILQICSQGQLNETSSAEDFTDILWKILVEYFNIDLLNYKLLTKPNYDNMLKKNSILTPDTSLLEKEDEKKLNKIDFKSLISKYRYPIKERGKYYRYHFIENLAVEIEKFYKSYEYEPLNLFDTIQKINELSNTPPQSSSSNQSTSNNTSN